jgi:hypothetical protein
MKASGVKKRISLKNSIYPIFEKKYPVPGRNKNTAFAGLFQT